MAKYKKCPRCELNYILEEEDYCEVCKQELKGLAFNIELDEDDGEICPVCHVNFLEEGQKMCDACAEAKNAEKRTTIDDVEYEWNGEDDDETLTVTEDDDDMELSLEDLAEEEGEDDYDDKMYDEEEYVDSYDDLDDLDDDEDDEDIDDEDDED